MVKQVQMGRATLERAAEEAKVALGEDVRVAALPNGALAVRGRTLLGQLFLSVLVGQACS